MVSINLRKANDIRVEIATRLKATEDVRSEVRLSVYDVSSDDDHLAYVAGKVAVAREEMEESLGRMLRLSDILLDIRKKVGHANAVSHPGTSGVSVADIMANIAGIDQRLSIIRSLTGRTTGEKAANVSRRLGIMVRGLEGSERGYGHEREISVSVLSDERKAELETELLDLKRARDRWDDVRTATNSQVTIEIADDDYAFLQELRIV